MRKINRFWEAPPGQARTPPGSHKHIQVNKTHKASEESPHELGACRETNLEHSTRLGRLRARSGYIGPLGARGVLDVRVLSLCMLLSALSSALSSPNSCGFPSEALCVLLTCMCFPGLMKPRAAREMDQDKFQFSHVFPHRFLDGFLMDFGSIFDDFFLMILL